MLRWRNECRAPHRRNRLTMLCSRTSLLLLAAFLSQLSVTLGALVDTLPNAEIEVFGIVRGRDLDGREIFAADDAQAELAPDAQQSQANTSHALVDRSLELTQRQTCNPGYGYCSCKYID
jgi:hypothetical protein